MAFDDYRLGNAFDEMFRAPGMPRPGCTLLAERLAAMDATQLIQRQRAAELAMLNLGITFHVYGDEAGGRKNLSLRHRAPCGPRE